MQTVLFPFDAQRSCMIYNIINGHLSRANGQQRPQSTLATDTQTNSYTGECKLHLSHAQIDNAEMKYGWQKVWTGQMKRKTVRRQNETEWWNQKRLSRPALAIVHIWLFSSLREFTFHVLDGRLRLRIMPTCHFWPFIIVCCRLYS